MIPLKPLKLNPISVTVIYIYIYNGPPGSVQSQKSLYIYIRVYYIYIYNSATKSKETRNKIVGQENILA